MQRRRGEISTALITQRRHQCGGMRVRKGTRTRVTAPASCCGGTRAHLCQFTVGQALSCAAYWTPDMVRQREYEAAEEAEAAGKDFKYRWVFPGKFDHS